MNRRDEKFMARLRLGGAPVPMKKMNRRDLDVILRLHEAGRVQVIEDLVSICATRS